MEYNITGLANSAATSRIMWIDSASKSRRCDDNPIWQKCSSVITLLSIDNREIGKAMSSTRRFPTAAGAGRLKDLWDRSAAQLEHPNRAARFSDPA